MFSAAGGESHHCVRPTTRSPAPMANRISVNEGRRETIRCDGPTAGRPDGLQPARTKTTNRSLRSTIPPAREPTGGANEDVSWLRAIQLAFPGYPSGIEPITTCPLQWRGRARLAPAPPSPAATEEPPTSYDAPPPRATP